MLRFQYHGNLALNHQQSEQREVLDDQEKRATHHKLCTNVVFYKRQMWTYNLGVHDCSNDKGYMFMWPESIASRGSKETSSCLLKYLKLRQSNATD